MKSTYSATTRQRRQSRPSWLPLALVLLALSSALALAQMPGMPEEKPRSSAPATAAMSGAALDFWFEMLKGIHESLREF